MLDKKRFEVKNNNKFFTPQRIKNIVFTLCYIGIIGTIFYNANIIYAWQKDGAYTKELQSDFVKFADIKETNISRKDLLSSVKNEDSNKYYFKYTNLKNINANFEILQNINDEVTSWIKVPSTKVNYPVVQGNDNKYYLSHSFDKSDSSIGWVFLDYRNNKYFNDKNTVIYSNGKLDDVLFGSLNDILDVSWYNELSNRIIKTSTKTNNNLWEIFSVYNADKDEIMISFNSDNEYINYLNKIKNKSIFNFNIDVNNIEKILTLKSFNDKKSIIIHARLISHTINE